MNRLRQYQRGTLSEGGGAITAPIDVDNTDLNRTYVLDGLGNWQKTAYTPKGGSLTVEKRQHNFVNEITLRKMYFGPANLTYNANGNLLSDTINTYEYDAFNRIVNMTTQSDGQVGHYNYDALNRRSRRQTLHSIPNFIHEYLYNGWQCMETRDASNTLLTQYAWGLYLDELVMQRNVTAVNDFASNVKLYPMQDMLYRTTGLAGDAGAVYEAYDTDAYGNTLIFRNPPEFPATPPPAVIAWTNDDTQVPVPTCDFIFTGQRFDFESGLYYYKNRYYSAELGRFLTRDPLRKNPQNVSIGIYVYANSNSLVRTDMFGLDDYQVSGSGSETMRDLIYERPFLFQNTYAEYRAVWNCDSKITINPNSFKLSGMTGGSIGLSGGGNGSVSGGFGLTMSGSITEGNTVWQECPSLGYGWYQKCLIVYIDVYWDFGVVSGHSYKIGTAVDRICCPCRKLDADPVVTGVLNLYDGTSTSSKGTNLPPPPPPPPTPESQYSVPDASYNYDYDDYQVCRPPGGKR